MNALVHLRKKTGAGGATRREPVLATSLWGVIYAEDAGVVSRSLEQTMTIMGVMMIVCAAFDLTVSEATNEIMCLRMNGMPESTAIFSV